jgi:DHA2 family methylenomycin A resistance protein-like MFS transporter
MPTSVAPTTSAETAGRQLAPAVLATTLGFAAVQLDGAMLNIAFVDVGRSLQSGIGHLPWVVNAHAVAFVCLLVSAGALGDRIGARRVFLCGFALFGVASAACALAPSLWALIVARALQGAGGALLVPSSLALLNQACRGDAAARTRAVGLWAAAGGVAVAVGPAVSGVLVNHAGWRSVFLVSAAAAAFGAWLTTRIVEDTGAASKPRGFDWTGQFLATLALGALVGAIIAAGSSGWRSGFAALALLVAVAAMFGFVRAEARAAHPIAPPAVLRDRRVAATMAVGFAVSFSIFGLVFGLALYFQHARGYTPVETGLAFVPFSLAIVAANLMSGRVAATLGADRVLLAGLLLAAAGLGALVAVLDGTASYAEELPAQLGARIGIGLIVPMATTLLLASVPQEVSGVASGAFAAIRQAGSAVGVATYGALMAAEPVAGLRVALVISMAMLLVALAVSAASFRRHRQGNPASREA